MENSPLKTIKFFIMVLLRKLLVPFFFLSFFFFMKFFSIGRCWGRISQKYGNCILYHIYYAPSAITVSLSHLQLKHKHSEQAHAQ